MESRERGEKNSNGVSFVLAVCYVLAFSFSVHSHHSVLLLIHREQPIFTTRAHVFQIDPTTKKNWVPASKQAVTVSYFYDSTRNSYRIISVDGSKVSRIRTEQNQMVL